MAKSIQMLVDHFVREVRVQAMREARAELLKSIGGDSENGLLNKGVKREPAAINALTVRLLHHIKQHPGLRIEKIAEGMQVATKELNLPIKRLIGNRSIRTKGQRRATTYTAK